MEKVLQTGARVGPGGPRVKVENPGEAGDDELAKMTARLRYVMETYELDEETYTEIDAAIEKSKRIRLGEEEG